MTILVEGQVYEGPVAALGGEAPVTRWLVISPHGKIHAHSLDDPLELHCMPVGIMEKAIAEGRLELVDMLEFLDQAVAERQDYVEFLAGEILTLSSGGDEFGEAGVISICERVRTALRGVARPSPAE